MTLSAINLYKSAKKQPLKVISTPKNNLLENMGLRVGSEVKIENRYAFGGPVLLRVEDSFVVAIGKDIATQIAVRRIVS